MKAMKMLEVQMQQNAHRAMVLRMALQAKNGRQPMTSLQNLQKLALARVLPLLRVLQ